MRERIEKFIMYKKLFVLIITICLNTVGCTKNFDDEYQLNRGYIDYLDIDGFKVKYYHHNNLTTKNISTMEKKHFIVKLNPNVNSKILKAIQDNANSIFKTDVFFLKNINAISFELEENKLIDFIKNVFSNRIKYIEYIEKVPPKQLSDINIEKMFDKVNTSNQNTETHIIASENPNDPFFSKQWHLNIQSNITDIGFIGYRKYLKDSNYTCNFKKPTVIGVIDVGIFYDYLDLINRIYINSKEIPNNKKDDDNNYYIDDNKGVDVGHPECTLSDINCANAYQDHHGTMMSSIIASETDNNLDIAGIAPDEVKLLPINASYDFKGVDRYIEGYDYLLDMKKKVVTLLVLIFLQVEKQVKLNMII